LAEVVDSLGSLDYSAMLTVSSSLRPFHEVEDETYEEVDLSLIDMDSLSPDEITQLMEKKKKADMMKERQRKRREDPEANEKQEALLKGHVKKMILMSTEGLLFVFGDAATPFTGYIDIKNLKAFPMRVPNNFRLFSNIKVQRLLDKTCLLFEETPQKGFPKDEIIHFDPHFWTFNVLPARGKAIYDSTIIQLSGEVVYFIGGKRKTDCPLLSNHVESFTFADQKWKLHASMLKTRLKFSCYSWNKAIYVIGGANTDNDIENSIERFDPLSNSWEILNLKFTTAIYGGFPIVRKNDVLILGGLNKTMVLDTVYSVCVLKDIPPRISFVKNLPILKSLYNVDFIDLGFKAVVVYTEGDSRTGPGRRVARYIDLDSIELGPELEIDVAAQLARLGVCSRAFG
jgi:hypothetical protein